MLRFEKYQSRSKPSAPKIEMTVIIYAPRIGTRLFHALSRNAANQTAAKIKLIPMAKAMANDKGEMSKFP